MVGSDYYLTFLERSVLSEAFLTLFAPGIYVSNTYFDDNVTTHAMFHKSSRCSFYDGASFGDGNYAFTTRATWTPVYKEDGACVVHLGGSLPVPHRQTMGRAHRADRRGQRFLDSQDVVRFRARPELRDAVGVSTPVIGGTSGPLRRYRLLRGPTACRRIDPEFMVTWGPLNFRAESAFAFVDRARTLLLDERRHFARQSDVLGGVRSGELLPDREHWGYDRRQGVLRTGRR